MGKKTEPFILTEGNYFSREASENFFGHSELVSATECMVKALTETLGEGEESKDYYIQGSYFDALICGERESFEEAHPELWQTSKKTPTLYAKYQQILDAYERVMQDPVMVKYSQGEHQTVYTGYITGAYSGKQYPVKVKPDGLIMDDKTGKPKLVVDYKCLKDLDRIWSDAYGEKVHPALARGYDVQAWMYRKVIAEHYGMKPKELPFILFIATKEKPANLALLQFHEGDIMAAGDRVEHMIDEYASAKRAYIETGQLPEGCGRDSCPICRARKQIKGIDWIEK